MEFWTYAQIRSQGTLPLPPAVPQAHWLGTEIPPSISIVILRTRRANDNFGIINSVVCW